MSSHFRLSEWDDRLEFGHSTGSEAAVDTLTLDGQTQTGAEMPLLDRSVKSIDLVKHGGRVTSLHPGRFTPRRDQPGGSLCSGPLPGS